MSGACVALKCTWLCCLMLSNFLGYSAFHTETVILYTEIVEYLTLSTFFNADKREGTIGAKCHGK